jgi:hypothetical protein
VQPLSNASLGVREQWHRHGSYGGEADPDPACPRLIGSDKSPERLHGYIRGKDVEARGDHLLSSALSGMRPKAGSGEKPDDDESRDGFDQAVGSEPDQSDGASRNTGRNGDRELNEVPPDSSPCEEPRTGLPEHPIHQQALVRRSTCAGSNVDELLSHD